MSEQRWPERRFSQAISEGDGISIIPVLRRDLHSLARAAEEAGAEALALDSIEDVASVRTATELPLLVCRLAPTIDALEAARGAGADACVLPFDELVGEEELPEELVNAAWDLGLDVVLDVRDEAELERALELLDPEILLFSARAREKEDVKLERTLDLLADVPAGKLVVSQVPVRTREQVLALERAGIDAVVLEASSAGEDGVAGVVSELSGRSETPLDD